MSKLCSKEQKTTVKNKQTHISEKKAPHLISANKKSLDKEWHKAISETLTEWNSSKDEKEFNHL